MNKFGEIQDEIKDACDSQKSHLESFFLLVEKNSQLMLNSLKDFYNKELSSIENRFKINERRVHRLIMNVLLNSEEFENKSIIDCCSHLGHPILNSRGCFCGKEGRKNG
jgi:hypothetical protein